MMKQQLTETQRAAILQAADDARRHAPVALKVDASGRQVMAYDAIDLASETGNYWWTGGMSNEHSMAALRLVHRCLRGSWK